MNALVLAGGLMTPEDPLYSEEPKGRRSLIDINGRPMVQWVIDALAGSQVINEIYLIGLPTESGLKADKPLHFLEDQDGMFENIRFGVLQASQDEPSQSKVIVASGDIPAIRPNMVDWLAAQTTQNPNNLIYYNVIAQPTMEARFPKAERSFVRFKDIAVCGGDMNVIDRRLFTVERPIWKKLTDARKHPLKQVSFLGFYNLMLVALHLVTLKSAVQRVCKKLSVDGEALLSPFAELAMDADKPHQLAILRRDLEGRP